MKNISIIVACYNEAGSIKELYKRVCSVFAAIPYDFELVFVDNASTDNSEQIFNELAQLDSRVKVIIMSRNFGSSQPSLLAGLRNATGQAVVFLDGDLQDPPELIFDFVRKWEEGFQVVYAVRKKRKGSLLRRIGYKCFYRLFKFLSYIDIPLDAGDCCLIDRQVVDILKTFNERDLYIRGLRAWVGFKQTGVEYVREDRFSGKTSCRFFANFFWAKKAIVNFSYKPLEFISKLAGFTVMLSTIALAIYVFLGIKYHTPRGFTTLLVVVLFLGAIQLLALSIIGEYLARIFEETKARPHYIVRKTLNIQDIETDKLCLSCQKRLHSQNHEQQNQI